MASTVRVIFSTVTVSVKNMTTPSDIQKNVTLEQGIKASPPVKTKRKATLNTRITPLDFSISNLPGLPTVKSDKSHFSGKFFGSNFSTK